MKNKAITFLLFFVIFTSCFNEEDEINLALINSKLEEESANYLKIRLFNCRQDVLREAEAFVDSIIINEMSFNIGGNLYFPNRPNKPGYIGKIQLNDTTRPKPFLDLSKIYLPTTTSILDSINN